MDLVVAEAEMIKVDERERIRRAYFLEGKSIRQIAREMKHSRTTVKNAMMSVFFTTSLNTSSLNISL